jgi:hypothetical protein
MRQTSYFRNRVRAVAAALVVFGATLAVIPRADAQTSQVVAVAKKPRSHRQARPVESRNAFAGTSTRAHVSALFTKPRRQAQRSPDPSSIALAGTTTAVHALLLSLKPRSHFHPCPYDESTA